MASLVVVGRNALPPSASNFANCGWYVSLRRPGASWSASAAALAWPRSPRRSSGRSGPRRSEIVCWPPGNVWSRRRTSCRSESFWAAVSRACVVVLLLLRLGVGLPWPDLSSAWRFSVSRVAWSPFLLRLGQLTSPGAPGSAGRPPRLSWRSRRAELATDWASSNLPCLRSALRLTTSAVVPRLVLFVLGLAACCLKRRARGALLGSRPCAARPRGAGLQLRPPYGRLCHLGPILLVEPTSAWASSLKPSSVGFRARPLAIRLQRLGE